MILVCGIPSEPPVARLIDRLIEMDAPFVVFNQRDSLASHVWHKLDDRGHEAGLVIHGRHYDLGAVRAAYCRLIEPGRLPEVAVLPGDHFGRVRACDMHDILVRYLEVCDATVVNRYSAMASNASKPFQAQIIQSVGLRVPETLISNDPDAVRAFAQRFREVIYKSISGTRSIVRVLERNDLRRLDRIRWCPTQFQERVAGNDIRVHVIGDRVIATGIRSTAIDYRYAHHDGTPCDLEPTVLDAAVEARCVALAARMGLAFAGIDLRLAPDGNAYCFEVNPSPGYSFYEDHGGGQISLALAEYLVCA